MDNSKYTNWIKTSVALLHLNQALADFIQDILNDLRDKINGHVGDLTDHCLKCKGTQIKKVGRWTIECSVCSKWLDAILSECLQKPHKSPVEWKHTDPKRWPTDNWELVKPFLPPGNYASTSPSECDISALLTLAMNCKFLRQCFGNRKLLKQVKLCRNDIMHSKHLEVDVGKSRSYMNDMIGILEDPLHMERRPASKKAVEEIKELRDKDYKLLPKKDDLEMQAFQSLFEDRMQLLQEQIDCLPKDNGDVEKLKADVDSLRKQVQNKDMAYQNMSERVDVMHKEIDKIKGSVKSNKGEINKISSVLDELTNKFENVFRESGPLASFIETATEKHIPAAFQWFRNLSGDTKSEQHKSNANKTASGETSTNSTASSKETRKGQPKRASSRRKNLTESVADGVESLENLVKTTYPSLGTRVQWTTPDGERIGTVSRHEEGFIVVTLDKQSKDGSFIQDVVVHDKIPNLVTKEPRNLSSDDKLTAQEDCNDPGDNENACRTNEDSLADCLGKEVSGFPFLGTRVKQANVDEEGVGTVSQHDNDWLLITMDKRTKTGDCKQVLVSVNEIPTLVYVEEPRVVKDELIAEGCWIERGPDWCKEHADSDGGPGNIGVVYKVQDNEDGPLVYVRWSNGHRYVYGYGYKGRYEVKLLADELPEETDDKNSNGTETITECDPAADNTDTISETDEKNNETTDVKEAESGDSKEEVRINNRVEDCVEVEGYPALGTRVAQNSGSDLTVGTVTGHKPKGFLLITWDKQDDDCQQEEVAISNVSQVMTPRVLGKELIAVGCRVERGAGWRYENQDGGEGNHGTVIAVNMEGIVTVRWDGGGIFTYRYLDVEIVEEDVSKQTQITVHEDEIASRGLEKGTTAQTGPETETSDGTERTEHVSAKKVKIKNRVKDMIELEELPHLGSRVVKHENNTQKLGTIVGHVSTDFLLVTWDESEVSCKQEVSVGDVFGSQTPRTLHNLLIAVGCRVKRGSDWRYKDQDGGDGCLGSVIDVSSEGVVRVRWDNGGVYTYRFGDKNDVEVV